MTDETKRIFDAPWVLFSDPDNEVFQIESNSGDFVAEAMMFTEAKCLVRLPELYDSLMYAVKDKCSNCGFSVATNPVDFCKNCKYKEFSKLLEDVRKGK